MIQYIQIKFYMMVLFFLYLITISAYPQGTMYEVYPNLPHVEYWGVYFFNLDTGFAVGEEGIIIKTTDGGASWIQKSSPTNNTLWKIQAFSSNNIFICGFNGTLLHSIDKGENWEFVNLNVKDDFLALKIIDQQTAWLCGADSILFKTEDTGNNWVRKVTGFSGYLKDIDFYNANVGYICSTTSFLVTENGGKTWVSKILGGFNTVEPLSENIVLAGAPTGGIYYSEDRA